MPAREQASDLDFNDVARILNLPAPSDLDEPARLRDLQSALEGLNWKDSVTVTTESNVNLSSPGDTHDGVALTSGDTILLRGQTNDEENGAYVYTASDSPLTRRGDSDTAASLLNAIYAVDEGTTYGGTRWRQTEIVATLDTDDVLFEDFSSSAPPASESTAGLVELATNTEVNTGSDTERAVTPAGLAQWSGRARRTAANVGNGSATQIDVTHNYGTRDVTVEVYRNSGDYDKVDVYYGRPDTNTVRLEFAAAPSSNEFRVIVTHVGAA